MAASPFYAHGQGQQSQVIIEGYLKKVKNILINQKSFYRVIDSDMWMGSAPDKQLKKKYDLTNYYIELSKKEKCKFYLIPNHDNLLGLTIVRMITENVEERGLWYKKLQEVMPTEKRA